VSDELDWRLEIGERPWMHGAKLRWTAFEALTEDWDHEHCALCGAKFMAADGDGLLREGYLFREKPHGKLRPAEQRTRFHGHYRLVESPSQDEWVCETCFADFEGYFRWSGERP
jgi:hypothetical protein